jgi:hypothetical protein
LDDVGKKLEILYDKLRDNVVREFATVKDLGSML